MSVNPSAVPIATPCLQASLDPAADENGAPQTRRAVASRPDSTIPSLRAMPT